jgi:uncharacterized membrane protein
MGIFPPLGGRKRTSAAISVLLMTSAQIAMPLINAPVFLSWVVIAALASSTCTFALLNWGRRRVAAMVSGIFFLAMAIEAVGVHSGVPFGRYFYTSSLQPQVLEVPVLVGLAWVAMLLPAWEIARRITPRSHLRAPLVGLAMTIWDLFLDPQMIGYGFWRFENPSGWNGVPLSNALGWFVAGTVLSLLPMMLLRDGQRNDGLAFLYTWMIGFSALGYLIPFALNDVEIGLVGGLCAAPLLFLAFQRKDRPWLASP